MILIEIRCTAGLPGGPGVKTLPCGLWDAGSVSCPDPARHWETRPGRHSY